MKESGIGINLGQANPTNEKRSTHIPSAIQADTLFTFMSDLEFLFSIIKSGRISPRYCDEDISYLGIKDKNKLAYPMKCFCDINLHRLGNHLACYGCYGLAFTKEWGMKQKIQPIQYINPESVLCKDFASAFNKALEINRATQTEAEHQLKSYLLHQLMYYKPYSGHFRNRVKNVMEKRCFMDECEWRYIPDLSGTDFVPVYFDEQIINAGVLTQISNAMAEEPKIALRFDYSEIKHIIVQSREDFKRLTDIIVQLDLEQPSMFELISKVIIWDEAKGDF